VNSSDSRLFRIIAVFKLLKASALFLTGLGVLKLVHKDVGTELEHWVAMLGFDPDRHLIARAIQRVTHIPPHRIRELGIASFVYSALFLTEGIGLWMLKQWAEWFTVIITSSLVPVEALEIYRHPTVAKVLVLLINLAVVAYLIHHIKQERDRVRKNISQMI
jgi:uncharacterized membrane protein (DUF2068 family)